MLFSGPGKARSKRKSYAAIPDAEIATGEITIRGRVYPCPANYITIDRMESGEITVYVRMDTIYEEGETASGGVWWTDPDFPLESLRLEHGNMLKFTTPLFDWDDPDGSFHFTSGTYAIVLTPKGVAAFQELLAYLSLTT